MAFNSGQGVAALRSLIDTHGTRLGRRSGKSALQRSVEPPSARKDAPHVASSGDGSGPGAKKYPRWVRLGIMLAGGLASWAAVIAAGWALYRAVA